MELKNTQNDNYEENLELLKIDNKETEMKVMNLSVEIDNFQFQVDGINQIIKDKKEALFNFLEKFGINSLSTQNYTFSRVGESTRKSLDTTKLKEEEPQIYEKYLKTSKVKSYLKVSKKTKKDNNKNEIEVN